MVIERRLYTVEKFEQFIAQPDNADRLFELVEGEIVEKVPTERHSLIAGNIYAARREFVKAHGLGRVIFEVRYRMPDDPHNARIPDVSLRAKR